MKLLLTIVAITFSFCVFSQNTSLDTDEAGIDNVYEETLAIGAEAASGYRTTHIKGNVFLGYRAGYNLANGSGIDFNVLIGYNTGFGMNAGSTRNLLIGRATGSELSGQYNLAFGDGSAYRLDGDNNIILGKDAGFYASGSNNIFIGHQTGEDNTGSNIFIGQISSGASTLGITC